MSAPAPAAGTARPRHAPWRTALITGATAGIGLAFADILARDGTHLVLVARDGDRLAEVADRLRARHPIAVTTIAADLRTDAGLTRIEDRLRDGEAPIDLLVNNAGTGTRGAFHTLPVQAELDVVALSAVAVVRLCRAALAPMVERGSGWIVNVSSLAGFQPDPLTATYGAAKAFSLSLSEALYDEVRGSGVRVTALCPSFTATEFHRRAGIDVSRVPARAWLPAERVALAGLRAVERGRPVCVPGTPYRLLAALSTVAPRRLARFGSRVFAGAR
ncbi:SDR family oxidoreductase [Embleya sp. NBC_00888]|uniref:SDR family NAD(P)-dependent oxidoreductase n=1 Tax=Embleya sp. NBC_00888 TaxID=2975960 RepID=UPI0038652515|nr:SDR family oxidoreductase [Embleya sp. NBC_00888]